MNNNLYLFFICQRKLSRKLLAINNDIQGLYHTAAATLDAKDSSAWDAISLEHVDLLEQFVSYLSTQAAFTTLSFHHGLGGTATIAQNIFSFAGVEG